LYFGSSIGKDENGIWPIGKLINGNTISVPVWKVNVEERTYVPFTGNITIKEGELNLNQAKYDSNMEWVDDDYYYNKAPITFTNGNATINFGTQMEYYTTGEDGPVYANIDGGDIEAALQGTWKGDEENGTLVVTANSFSSTDKTSTNAKNFVNFIKILSAFQDPSMNISFYKIAGGEVKVKMTEESGSSDLLLYRYSISGSQLTITDEFNETGKLVFKGTRQ